MTSVTGLAVKTDLTGGVLIALPRNSDFQEKVCGICGDFDDVTTNDWVIGPSDTDSDSKGTVVRFANVTGYKYRYIKNNLASDTSKCRYSTDIF